MPHRKPRNYSKFHLTTPLKREHNPESLTISQEGFSMTRLILSLGTALLLTVGTVWADPFEDAAAAYARGDYAIALKAFKSLAAQGDAMAQYHLGVAYVNGQGVPRDYTKAREWFEKAAVQGNAMAQHHLGVLYRNGKGVPQDYAKAREWYEKAAAQGIAEAQINLGMLYEGYGVPHDEVRAYMWYSLAAGHLSGDEQKIAVDNRDKAARSMTPDQIAEAQRLAQQCQAQQFNGC